MKPPIVVAVTIPNAQRTSRMTKIVQSMCVPLLMKTSRKSGRAEPMLGDGKPCSTIPKQPTVSDRVWHQGQSTDGL